MGWLIALGILIGIAVLPLGISAVFNADEPRVLVLIGPVRLKVYPNKNRNTERKTNQTKEKNTSAQSKQSSGGSAKDFLPLLHRVLAFLCDAKGKLRVKLLEMKLVLSGDDPSDLAVNYARAWASVGNLIPILERHFVIKKRNVEVQCDFTSDETRISARLDVTITVGRLLRLGVHHGIPALREYLNIIKLRKGGAKI